jgi:hypothetical protein
MMGYNRSMDLTSLLLEQLTFHWDNQVHPRLAGLTDDEYRWEPVPDAWSIRPRAEARSAMPAGGGDLVLDFEYPQPVPPPVTTIAWRMAHVSVGVFGMRNAAHFGGPPMDYQSLEWPADAQSALDLLDEVYAGWVKGVAGLDERALDQPVGEAEGPFAAHPYSTLVLHINREAIHHMAEVSLLRDLYRARS